MVETSYFGNLTPTDDPKVLIIPVPYEYTTSYNKGTKNGPQAILNASKYLEQFDDELWADVSKIGINTANFINCEFVNNKSMQPFIEVEEAVRKAVISGCLPIVIGGEHSISYGSIRAIYDLYPDVSLLHFGAFPILKDSYQNNKFAYPCALRQIYEVMPDIKIVMLGTRGISGSEKEWLENNGSKIEIFWANNKNNWNMTDIISSLTKNVYLTFSFDVLDSGIMPSVITPEPGGLNWEQTISILKNVSTFKDIVGIDFLGFSPIQGLQAPDLLAAKLIYKSIGYIHARQLGAFEEDSSALVASDS